MISIFLRGKTRALIITLSVFVLYKGNAQNKFCDYVDVNIGTLQTGIRDQGNCTIGPQLPFGAINPGPQTPNGHHDGYSPDENIRGFGQLHVSGTGWGKYGQIFLSPQIGFEIDEEAHDSPKTQEKKSPYEYGVTLTRYGIRTEVAPARHSAIYRFIFPESKQSNIVLDLSHHITKDIATIIGGEFSAGTISIDTVAMKVSGYGEYFGGFGDGKYPVYFSAELSEKPARFGTWKNGIVKQGNTKETLTALNDRMGVFFNYQTKQNQEIYVKVGISMKSVENAQYWLDKEIPDFNYKIIKEKAKEEWEDQLSKIEVEGVSKQEKTIFYTALYHAMLMPRNRTNNMRGFDETASVWDDHYAVWDTWRTLFPLMVLINPEMVADNINAFIERYKVNSVVKDAFIAGNDMIAEQGGNNVDNIIVDAYLKGIEGVNWNDAYNIVKEHADGNTGRLGWQGFDGLKISDSVFGYKKNGWLPAGIMSCSYTLEYAYNDFCAATMAKSMGKLSDANRYFSRSKNWENLWNPDAVSDGFKGFIVPKTTEGSFVEIDLKKNWGSWKNYFYEASSWTYSFFVPHQINRLIELCGGNETYTKRLIYAIENNLTKPSSEQSFLTLTSFIHAGRADLSSKYIREKLKTYTNTSLPGNDDSGAMSSWYVFSAMGIFPNAGQDFYYLFGSKFSKSTISLKNGKKIIIESKNASEKNIYVQSCKVNGKPWNKATIKHDVIKNGAHIEFIMGESPSKWGQNITD